MGVIEKQNSFNLAPNKIPQKASPVRGGGKLIPGEILEIKKNRAKIRAFTGDVYDNVKLPSASINKLGQPNGRSGGWKKTQMVALGFAMDSPNMPIVLQGFGFSANQLNEQNLKTFYAAYPTFTGEIDFQDFHDSGYSIKYGTTITYYDTTKVPFLEIDFIAKTFKIMATGIQVSFGSAPTIPVSNGTLINQWMTQMYNCIAGLQSAVAGTIIIPGDGGASLKAAINAAFSSASAPTAPPALNATNLKIS